jgi:hypothetical protein
MAWCSLFLALPEEKRAKGRMARIVPNHSAFTKRHDSRVTFSSSRNVVSLVKMRAYFGGGGCGGGRSELNISTAASHLPSGCLRTIVTNLPESLTEPGAPGGVIVIV